jgi:glycerol-3-phosphate acyltransferase PlsY
MPEFTLDYAARVLAAFLLGSIPFAVLSMLGSGIDIRRVGSGNPGFNNVLRVSRPRAVLCLAGDLGKGVAAILLLWRGGEPMAAAWLLGFAVMLGHCFSPFLRFNGGKGIATSAGVMLVLYLKLALPCIAAYILLRIAGSRLRIPERGAVASLCCWALFAVLVLIFAGPREAAWAAVMFAIIGWRHADNIRRALAEARA